LRKLYYKKMGNVKYNSLSTFIMQFVGNLNLKDSLNTLAIMQANKRIQDKRRVYWRKEGKKRVIPGTAKNKS